MTLRDAGLPVTARQLQILAAYAAHGSYQEAADCLGIALPTVRETLSAAYARLRVGTGLVAVAAVGWLRLPEHRQRS